MRFGTAKIFLLLSLVSVWTGAVRLTAVPAATESTASYVAVDSGKLFQSTQFSRFEKIWENGVFFVDTLRREAAKYQFTLEELQPRAALVIDWKTPKESIVAAEFPQPVKARFLKSAAEFPQIFNVDGMSNAAITVKESAAPDAEIDYSIIFISDNKLIAGHMAVMDAWLANEPIEPFDFLQGDTVAYCHLMLPEKSGSDFVDLMLGGAEEVEAELTVVPDKIKLITVWRGKTVKDMRTALETIYNLGVGMLFGGSPEVANELRLLPEIEIVDGKVAFNLEINDEMLDKILMALKKNFEAQKYMVDYDGEGW